MPLEKHFGRNYSYRYFVNNLRKYEIENFETVSNKCQKNHKTNYFEKNLG